MSIGSRIKQRREELGITQTELAEMLGVTKGAVGNYETDANSPKASILYKVFDVLQCDANFIFQDEEKERQSAKLGRLSDVENQLIAKYRALDKRGKETVNIILERETERLAEIKRLQDSFNTEAAEETIFTFLLPYSVQPASAGTGMFLGPDNFEMMRVQQNDMTRRTAFCVPVRGNSMEPDYHDGDTLLIEAANDIRVGEVGVFTLNGQGYVKKREDGELISLNPDYDPIPMDTDVRCNGRVIGILDPEWIVDQ